MGFAVLYTLLDQRLLTSTQLYFGASLSNASDDSSQCKQYYHGEQANSSA
jgi:hypothetical protein